MPQSPGLPWVATGWSRERGREKHLSQLSLKHIFHKPSHSFSDNGSNVRTLTSSSSTAKTLDACQTFCSTGGYSLFGMEGNQCCKCVCVRR